MPADRKGVKKTGLDHTGNALFKMILGTGLVFLIGLLTVLILSHFGAIDAIFNAKGNKNGADFDFHAAGVVGCFFGVVLLAYLGVYVMRKNSR